MAATDVRPKITLACNECKHRNYITKKNRRNDPDRMELKKFCPNCRSHTLHRLRTARRAPVVVASVELGGAGLVRFAPSPRRAPLAGIPPDPLPARG